MPFRASHTVQFGYRSDVVTTFLQGDLNNEIYIKILVFDEDTKTVRDHSQIKQGHLWTKTGKSWLEEAGQSIEESQS